MSTETQKTKHKNIKKDKKKLSSIMSTSHLSNSKKVKNSCSPSKSRTEQIAGSSITSEIQFVSVVNHYENLIKELAEDEKLDAISAEISILLCKFQELFCSQQKMAFKVKELSTVHDIYSKKNEDYEKLLNEKKELIVTLTEDLKNAKNEQHETIKLKNDAEKETERYKFELFHEQHKPEEVVTVKKDTFKSITDLERNEIKKLHVEKHQEEEKFEKELSSLKKELEEKQLYISDLNIKLNEATNALPEVRYNLLNAKQQIMVEVGKRNKADSKLVDVKAELKKKECIIKNQENSMQSMQTKIKTLGNKLKIVEDDKTEISKYAENLNQTLQNVKYTLSDRENTLLKLTTELENCNIEIRDLKHQMSSVNSHNKIYEKKICELELLKSEKDQQVELLQTENLSLGRCIEEVEEKLKKKEISKDEHGVLLMVTQGKLLEAKIKVKELMEETNLKQIMHEYLTKKTDTLQSNLKKEQHLNTELTTDKHEKEEEIHRIKEQFHDCINEITSKEAKLEKSEKQVSKFEQELDFEKKTHFDTVKALRTHKALLVNTENEVTKFTIELSTACDYIDDLNERIIKLEKELCHVEKEKSDFEDKTLSLKNDLANETVALQKCQSENNEKEKHNQILTKEISSTESNLKRVKKDLDNVTEEKNTLHILFTNKERELFLQHENAKIMDVILSSGNEKYNRQLDYIKFLKLELKNASRNKGLADKKLVTFDHLNEELAYMQREQIKEKLRVKALEGECSDNLHRWRILEGDDPKRHQLIIKNQFLQKKLIENTSLVVQKETELVKKKTKIGTLKEELKKSQLSAKILDDLTMYKHKYQQAKKHCDSLSSQVNMYSSQKSRCEKENLKLKEELYELKKKYVFKKTSFGNPKA